MGTNPIVRTIKCPLESSHKKNAELQDAAEEFRAAMVYASNILPGIPEQSLSGKGSGPMYRLVAQEEFSDAKIKASVLKMAYKNVITMLDSQKSRGLDVKRPVLGDSCYLCLPNPSNSGYDVVENERGYGLKAKYIPYDPTWWHMKTGSHQEKYIEKVLDGDASFGSAELHYNDGDPVVYITVNWNVDAPDEDDAENIVGIDLGERLVYTLSVCDADTGEIKQVETRNGRQFRHHRERLSKRRDKLQEKGELQKVKQTRNERSRYTENETSVFAREIVDIVDQYASPLIVLEDLTNYRKGKDGHEAIHDWPYAMIQEKISEKAREKGIAVTHVNARDTSETCRKCGEKSYAERYKREFYCRSCDYEVDADVNAAINLSQKKID